MLINASADVDVDASLNNGMTSLHLAAQYGYANIAEELVNAGANIQAKNAKGLAALDIAKEKGHIDVASVLALAARTRAPSCA